MDVVALPPNTESLLVYLLITPDRNKRSIEALHEMPNIEAAITWLTENGYAYDYNGCFELTLAGMHAARQVQNWRDMTTRTYQSAPQESEPRPVELPMVSAHPLRTRRNATRVLSQTMRFLLAYETPANVLPIPVLDGDLLGRDDEEVDIALGHDEYISGQHCRFSIQKLDERWVLCVEDLGSRNGTFINKRRLEKSQIYPLEHGTHLQIGSTMLKVVKIPD